MRNFIKKVVNLVQDKKQLANLPKFVEEFYSQNHFSDFKSYSQSDLAQYAEKSFSFFQSKRPLEYKIRATDVENPSYKHTILDIITKDCPFLVDSLVALVEEGGHDILNIMHPIFRVERDGTGNLKKFESLKGSDLKDVESVIQIHLKDELPKDEKESLTKKIEETLSNITIVVNDWQKMTVQVQKSQDQIFLKKPSEDIEEIKNFIKWLVEKGFIFLGFIEFDYQKDAKGNTSFVKARLIHL